MTLELVCNKTIVHNQFGLSYIEVINGLGILTSRAEKLELHFGTRWIFVENGLLKIAVSIHKMNVKVVYDFVNSRIVFAALQSKTWMYLIKHGLITIG